MLRRARILVAAEQTTPCKNKMANKMPKLAPADNTMAPSDATYHLVDIRRATTVLQLTDTADDIMSANVQSMEQTKVVWPVILAQPYVR